MRLDRERDANPRLVPRFLPEETVFAGHLVVIAGVDDDGVFEEALAFEHREEVAEHLVEVVDTREVGGPSALDVPVVEMIEASLVDETARHRMVARVALPSDLRAE